jgi:hypothetical protein
MQNSSKLGHSYHKNGNFATCTCVGENKNLGHGSQGNKPEMNAGEGDEQETQCLEV